MVINNTEVTPVCHGMEPSSPPAIHRRTLHSRVCIPLWLAVLSQAPSFVGRSGVCIFCFVWSKIMQRPHPVGTQESKHERVAGYGCVCVWAAYTRSGLSTCHVQLVAQPAWSTRPLPSPAPMQPFLIWLGCGRGCGTVALFDHLVSLVHSTTMMRPWAWPLATWPTHALASQTRCASLNSPTSRLGYEPAT